MAFHDAKDDEIDVELGESLQRRRQGKCNRRGIFECIAQMLPESVEIGRRAKDRKHQKQVKEREKKVLRNHRQLDVSSRRHALKG